MRLLKEQSGQAVVLAAVSLAAILGMAGLAIDVGQLRYEKQRLQMAADAAALAGALELNACAGTADCSALQAAAQDALTENGFTVSSLQTNCASGGGTGLTLTVNNGPCALGAQDPHAGNTNFVEAVVSESEPTYFAGVLGIHSVAIQTRAEAALTGGPDCIYALDSGGSPALEVAALASVTAPCGIMDESANTTPGFLGLLPGDAFYCGLAAAVQVSQIDVVGDASTSLCYVSPTPKTNISVPSPADPLAYLPEPAVSPCGTSTASPYTGAPAALNIAGPATLYPGTYCGGINIMPGANVAFQPGTYILTSTNGKNSALPGGLQVDLGTNVIGNGVTFYNYGPAGGIDFSFASLTFGSVDFSAPTSGTYNGILFFQSPGNTTPATIAGSTSWNTTLQGTYYFPTASIAFALDGSVQYNILDAYDIAFEFLTFANGLTSGANQHFNNNYSSLANGSPVKGNGAVLVE